jgi:hypothetical protein
MTALSLGISTHYFGFRPVAGHFEDCPHHGTDMWEVTRYRDTRFDGEVRETVFRFACHDCGAVHLETVDGEPGTTETTSSAKVGYASRPEKVAGLWLWPGPLMFYDDDKRGPTAFYVTETRTRPRQPGDTVGLVAWGLGPRYGIKWQAGMGVSGHHTVTVRAEQDFSSRRAAVAWIAGELAAGRRPVHESLTDPAGWAVREATRMSGGQR